MSRGVWEHRACRVRLEEEWWQEGLHTRSKVKHGQCGNGHNSEHRGASDCKVTGGNGSLLLPAAAAGP